MKKILFTMAALVCMTISANAQNGPAISFDKTTHNFGSFPETQPVQKTTFTFTNTGTAPLIVNQAVASCGCTAPKYTKTPVMPGETGTIDVTYNGKGSFPGHFKKTVTVRTNGTPEMVRLYIEGDMTEAK
jgi:hypothetical protein